MTQGYLRNQWLLAFRRNGKGIALMLASSLMIAVGQMCWKFFQPMGFPALGTIVLLAGFVLYALGALVMIAAFRFGELSVLHPFLSSSYVFAIVIGYFVFHETLSCMKFFSIVLIGAGLILLGASGKNAN